MVAPGVALPDAIFLRSRNARSLWEKSRHLDLAAYLQVAIEAKVPAQTLFTGRPWEYRLLG
jgi:hypothetical protein